MENMESSSYGVNGERRCTIPTNVRPTIAFPFASVRGRILCMLIYLPILLALVKVVYLSIC